MNRSLQLILGISIFISFAFDIVRRHDKSDVDYLELGKKFPAVCKVGVRGGDGTLIDSEWVITAAHVAEGMYRREGENLKVYFANTPEGILVTDIYLHPNFRPMAQGDIALLKLATPIDNIDPVEINQSMDELGKEIYIVGHGDSKAGDEISWVSDGQRRAATNTIDEVTKDKIIFDFDEPGDATEYEGIAGPGDSGGPAIIWSGDKQKIIGISSGGMDGSKGPGTYGAKEFYTRVSSYHSWITNKIKNPTPANTLNNKRDNRSKSPRSVAQSGRPSGGPLPGLGLFLMQEGDKIRIGGKADPEVPKEFRQVMFKPPSYLQQLNGKSYSSLEKFVQDFAKIDAGETFKIKFSIQGKILDFTGTKM